MRLKRAIVVAGLAMAALPAPSLAAEHVVRPDETINAGTWLRAGTGAPHELVDDAVTAPKAPYLLWDYLYATGNGAYTTESTEIGLAAPSIPATETVTGLTAHVYLGSGSARTVQVELLAGPTVLGAVTVPAGQFGAWRAVPAAGTPTPEQLADLRLRVVTSGSSNTSNSYLYAAYGAVSTFSEVAGPDDPQTSPPTGTGDGDDPAPDTEGSTPDTSVDAPVALPVTSLPLAASGILAVPVTCQLSIGCKGSVATELVSSAARSARRRKARAKSFRLKAGQSKKVPVVLDRRSARVVKRKGRARVKITIAVEGAPTVTKEVTVLERRRATRSRKPPKPPKRASGRGRGR